MNAIRLLSLVLICVLPFGQGKSAQTKRHSEASLIPDGNALHDLCRHYKEEGLKSMLGVGCLMYVGGVTQTLLLNDETDSNASPCPGKGVTEEQVTEVVIKWVEDHPADRNLPGPYLVMKALNEAFPCR
jgi:hypothetical protein